MTLDILYIWPKIKYILIYYSCAKLAKNSGYRYIGIQSYGECWSGDPTADLFKYQATRPNKCWGFRPHYSRCDDEAETECIGTKSHNYVYELYLTDSKGKCKLVLYIRFQNNIQFPDGLFPE